MRHAYWCGVVVCLGTMVGVSYTILLCHDVNIGKEAREWSRIKKRRFGCHGKIREDSNDFFLLYIKRGSQLGHSSS